MRLDGVPFEGIAARSQFLDETCRARTTVWQKIPRMM